MESPAFTAPLFAHLWFLWFLSWFVLLFALFVALAGWMKCPRPPKWLILSPARFLWLIPLTMVPQSLMGLLVPGFGADTSLGLLPMPHVFLYYALFFAFGVLYFDTDDRDGRVGKWWRLGLPAGLLVLFPLGLEFSTGAFGFRQEIFDPATARTAAVVLQAIYPWMMAFGCMGLFRKLCARENSDNPLFVGFVVLVVPGPRTAGHRGSTGGARLAPALGAEVRSGARRGHGPAVAGLPVLVRYTWLGRLLNGPRVRPAG